MVDQSANSLITIFLFMHFLICSICCFLLKPGCCALQPFPKPGQPAPPNSLRFTNTPQAVPGPVSEPPQAQGQPPSPLPIMPPVTPAAALPVNPPVTPSIFSAPPWSHCSPQCYYKPLLYPSVLLVPGSLQPCHPACPCSTPSVPTGDTHPP